jgi:transcriptional regulator with XRE-family HTH domain
MGKIPDGLRDIIAHNIHACRTTKYPGRGGGKKCAEEFGVSPQQWSPWETGKRTPDETRLEKIAEFFGVTVEFLRRDNRNPPPPIPDRPEQETSSHTGLETTEAIPGIDVPPPPGWQPEPPGSPASFFWLARYFVTQLQRNGLRLDKQCLDYLVTAIKRHPY